MTVSPMALELNEKLDEVAKRSGAIDPSEIVEVVEAIVGSLNGDVSRASLQVYSDVEALARYIEMAKTEIADIRPDEITDEHLPQASDQLGAIVGATEQATNMIFEAVESIEALTESMDPEVAAQVSEAVTAVFEACSFQDITGQRITKVVTALQQIESKVEALLNAFGSGLDSHRRDNAVAKKTAAPSGAEARPDEDLMNGPQFEGEGVSQDDIDALLGMD